MNLEEVKQFLEQNKESEEVKAYLQGLKTLSVEEVQSLVSTDKTLLSWLDSEKDKHSGKALETFKQKTMPKLIEEEIAKRNPNNKTPEQLKIEEALSEIDRWKSRTIRESVRNHALKFATENSIPSDIIDYFIALEKEDDEEGTKSKESTLTNLNSLKTIWDTQLQNAVNDKLKADGTTPNNFNNQKPVSYNREQLSKMSPEEIANLDQEVINEALKN